MALPSAQLRHTIWRMTILDIRETYLVKGGVGDGRTIGNIVIFNDKPDKYLVIASDKSDNSPSIRSLGQNARSPCCERRWKSINHRPEVVIIAQN